MYLLALARRCPRQGERPNYRDAHAYDNTSYAGEIYAHRKRIKTIPHAKYYLHDDTSNNGGKRERSSMQIHLIYIPHETVPAMARVAFEV
jgi:hypothetical protein